MKELAYPTVQRLTGPCGERFCAGGAELSWARSAPMRRLLAAVERLAPVRTAVLFSGEPGAGKDWLAHLLHRKSGRSAGLHLLRAEELGGESLDRVLPSPADPRASALHGSTLLVQEAGRLPAEAQNRLVDWLDALEPSQSIGPADGSVPDLRILATSTADLARSVSSGAFLPGLYWRLQAAELPVPPLRERREDIEGLVAILLSELEQKYDLGPFVVTDGLLEALRGAPWPGNVRQLRAVLERAIVLSSQELLDESLLPAGFASPTAAEPLEVRVGASLAEVERKLIVETLRAHGGQRQHTAQILGISRRKLQYRLRQYREEGLRF
jgi:DNA-binding NtrC family response regulator